MKELGVLVLGDRIMFMEFLKFLKKHKRDADRSKSLWSGTTPVLSCAYHQNCGQFCFHVIYIVIRPQHPFKTPFPSDPCTHMV